MRDSQNLNGPTRSEALHLDTGLLGEIHTIWPEVLRMAEKESVRSDQFLYEGITVFYENFTATNINTLLDTLREIHAKHKIFLRSLFVHCGAITVSLVKVPR